MLLLSIILLLTCDRNVIGSTRVQCDNADDECITETIKDHVYAQFIAGSPGVESSDPLRLDAINADLTNLKFSLKNPTLFGMKECNFVQLKLTVEKGLFSYKLLCPKLNLQSEYEVKGGIEGTAVEGKGSCKINYDNYSIRIFGKSERVKYEDGTLHVNILEHNYDLTLMSVATTDYENLVIGDNNKVDTYSKKLEETTREIVMKSFIEKLVRNLKDFHKAKPFTELHFRLTK